jgi:2-phospho-L-lactate/phosphoenolpyruvate guanylyltransferase
VTPWAVVPVKSFRRGKSRLAPVLDADRREQLARLLFCHVLEVLAACDGLAGTLVATDCPEAADLAQRVGAGVIRDRAGDPLAAVVDRALAEVTAGGGQSAVVLMADLPLLAVDDIHALIVGLAEAEVVLAPDVHGRCTNALALVPANALPSQLGRADSFARHVRQAKAAGHRLCILRRRGLALDLDEPHDLAEVRRRGAMLPR